MALKKIKPALLLLLAAVACLATGMSGCKPTEPPDLASASQKLTDALSANMRTGTPLTDKAQLADRLHLPIDRVKVFDTGIGEDTGRPTTGTAGIITCQGGTHCFCHGDSECNDMFESICRDPKTGGKCTTDANGQVTCDCYPLQAD